MARMTDPPTDAACAPPRGLAAGLRSATAAIHADLEGRLGLTQGLATKAGYAVFLLRHYVAFAMLEPPLARFPGWRAAGIDLVAHRRLPRLLADLAALQVDYSRISPPAIAAPASFPAALGALYVLEGASLGGKVILRHATVSLGGAIDGATAFFGAPQASSWPAFKSRLDAYGIRHPADMPQVVAGALAAFAVFESALVQGSC